MEEGEEINQTKLDHNNCDWKSDIFLPKALFYSQPENTYKCLRERQSQTRTLVCVFTIGMTCFSIRLPRLEGGERENLASG